MKILSKTLLATAIFSVCAFAQAQSNEPIKIGITGPFSGGSSPMGRSLRDGAKLAVGEINAKGGINGRKIVTVEKDDEAKNEPSIRGVKEMIEVDKVHAAVGYANSGVSLASQRLFQEAKIPVINNVSTATIITKQFAPPHHSENYIFRNSASDDIQGRLIVKEAVEKRKLTKLAIMADSTNYGSLGREGLQKYLGEKGIKPVAMGSFNVKETDMTKQLTKAKDAGAEAVLTYAIGPELAAVANSMEKIDFKVPIIGSWTLSMSNFVDLAGKNAEGATMPQAFIQEGDTPKRKAFIDSYLKKYNPPGGRIPSPASAAQAYDSIYLLAAAIKQAGSTEGPKIREALENLKEKVDGVVTTYDKPFTKDDHEALNESNVVMGVIKNGVVIRAK